MPGRRTMNYYLMKLNRLIVWALLVFMILLAVTGYGLTRPRLIESLTGGLISYWTAADLHALLDLPLLVLLLVHVMIEIKFSLMRWGFKSRRLLNVLMLMLGAAWLLLLVYVDTTGL